jgi:hypothetical protein
MSLLDLQLNLDDRFKGVSVWCYGDMIARWGEVMGWREKWDRVSLVLDGLLSGFILGMVFMGLVVARNFRIAIPIDHIILFMIAVAFGVAILVWSIHKALKAG